MTLDIQLPAAESSSRSRTEVPKSSLVPASLLWTFKYHRASQVELEMEMEMYISSGQLSQASEVRFLNLELNITINDLIMGMMFHGMEYPFG